VGVLASITDRILTFPAVVFTPTTVASAGTRSETRTFGAVADERFLTVRP